MQAQVDIEFEQLVKLAKQLPFWDDLLQKIKVLPFDKDVVKLAVTVNKQL